MYWLDWIIIFLPLVVVLIVGIKAQKYVKTVADFLAAGRVAGRYVICVASGEAGMGLISLVAVWEMYYKCGFAAHLVGSNASVCKESKCAAADKFGCVYVSANLKRLA